MNFSVFISFLLSPFLWLLVLFAFVFILAPMAALARMFPRPLQDRIVDLGWYPFHKIILYGVFLPRLKVVDKRKNKVWSTKRALYIANHQSLTDIPLVHSFANARPILKKELTKIPIFGLAAKASGVVTVDRKDRSDRKRAFMKSMKRMVSGIGFFYYPEGTRSRDPFPKPFEKVHTSLMEKAYELGIPVFPVSMYGTQNILKGIWVNPFQKLGIYLAQELNPADYPSAEVFAQTAWGQVIENYHTLEGLLRNKN